MALTSAKRRGCLSPWKLAILIRVELGEKLDVTTNLARRHHNARDSREHLEVGSGQMSRKKAPEIASNTPACACRWYFWKSWGVRRSHCRCRRSVERAVERHCQINGWRVCESGWWCHDHGRVWNTTLATYRAQVKAGAMRDATTILCR